MEEVVFLEKLAQRIKEIRIAKGMSQQELAAQIDYEKSNMSRLESGTVNPKIYTLYIVAKALNVSLKSLVDIE